MNKLLREPLMHFVLAAAVIFAVHDALLWRGGDDHTIHITTADMERMAALFASEARTLPSEADMRAMVTDHVRQEALAREAKRLGLDQGDTVIDRRLAQKMSFMITDLSEQGAPTEAELKAWYDTHANKFARPAQITFQHVFFSDPSDARIADTFTALNASADTDWRSLGDPFILQREYAGLPKLETTRLLGAEFADTLFAAAATTRAQPEPTWAGPLASPYGAHLYRIVRLVPAARPDFETVRTAVETDWRDTTTRTRNAEAVADVIARYNVVIEGTEP